MEVSISGAGYRPTIAAALYGDAAAVAAMAALDPRNDALVAEFAAYVNFSRASLERLWNENISSFAVLPCAAPPRRSREPTPTRLELRNDAPIVAADPCDLGAVRVPGAPVDVRELLAYAPFAFEGLVDESRDYEPIGLRRARRLGRDDGLGQRPLPGLREGPHRGPRARRRRAGQGAPPRARGREEEGSALVKFQPSIALQS